MTAAPESTTSDVPDWRCEGLALRCPFCGAQPPESCHGDPAGLAEFPGPGHRTVKMHAPRWRQVAGYAARIHQS